MDYMVYPKMGTDITALLKTEKRFEIFTGLELYSRFKVWTSHSRCFGL